MLDFKKYKIVYLILLALISLAFFFIFKNLSLIDASGKDVSSAIINLFFLNIVLIFLISLFYFIFIVITRNQSKLSQNKLAETNVISEKGKAPNEPKRTNEIEINNKLSQLENILSIEKNKEKMFDSFLKTIVKQTESVQGALFLTFEKEEKKVLRLINGYAFNVQETNPFEFYFGEGLTGQVAMDKTVLNLAEIKVDRMPVYSGMGSAVPQNLFICPLLNKNNNETIGVVELASFSKYDLHNEQFIEKAALLFSNRMEAIGINYQEEVKNE